MTRTRTYSWDDPFALRDAMAGRTGLEFRDVEGVSAMEAYLLSIGSGSDSRIYHTTDGGESWETNWVADFTRADHGPGAMR